MTRLGISVPFAVSIAAAVTLAHTPSAKSVELSAGAAMAVGDICSSMVSALQVNAPWTHSGVVGPKWHTALNQSIEIGYNAINRILIINANGNAEPLAGDIPMGMSQHAGGALDAINSFSTGSDLNDYVDTISDEIDTACREMLATGEAVFPENYPYEVPDD